MQHDDLTYSKSQTFELLSCELSNTRSCVQTGKLVHISDVHCHLCASSQLFVFLCTLLYSTTFRTTIECLYFKPRISRSKCKSSGDVACTMILLKVLNYKVKNAFLILCVFFNVLFFLKVL